MSKCRKPYGKLLFRLFISLFFITTFPLVSLSIAKAETTNFRVFAYMTKREVMPIGFAKAPANIIIERRGLAQLENGEVAIFLARGALKGTPKGGTGEGYSLLTYNDGSTTVIKWDIKFSKAEPKQFSSYTGSGKYIKGTGRFEGIQGEVVITGQEVTPFNEETRNDAYFDITATYSLPSK